MNALQVLLMVVLTTAILAGTAMASPVDDLGERSLGINCRTDFGQTNSSVSFYQITSGCPNPGQTPAPAWEYVIAILTNDGKYIFWEINSPVHMVTGYLPSNMVNIFVCHRTYINGTEHFIVKGSLNPDYEIQSQAPCSMSYGSSQCSSGACSI